MKRLFFGTLILGLVLVSPPPTKAEVNVDISISLPVPIVFVRPPELIVLPETYVYVVPDVDVDIFFYNGWWWRPWEGRWYRSRDYSSGWSRFPNVPSFYAEIPSSWRNDYKEHRWRGHQWDYQQIPHKQVQQNWRSWEKNRYWEKQKTWGVQGLQRQQSQPQLKAVQQQHQKADQKHKKAAKSQPAQQHREKHTGGGEKHHGK